MKINAAEDIATILHDARRYRWLRAQHQYDGKGEWDSEAAANRWFVMAGKEPVPCDPGALDAAIDYEMKGP
jgi:hypothetical protein